MTATPLGTAVRGVDERLASRAQARLEEPPAGGSRIDAVLRHQQLLDALDRHDYRRILVWPGEDPTAVAHLSASGTLIVAGEPDAGPDLASHMAGSGWRVLLGDAALATQIVESSSKGLRRRRVRAREQRFMATREPAPLPAPQGLRLATNADLEAATDFACKLHVEDQMGPPLSRNARAGVADRMRASIARSATWVVEQEGSLVAKFDVSLWTRQRGAQIAGVYVDERWRGLGIAATGVAAVSRALMDDGLPGVTLHVRADNPAGRRAYERAGYADLGPWTLALR